jgi:8-oxo-dGTP pyrophosphatase MutT (NUDIX family)
MIEEVPYIELFGDWNRFKQLLSKRLSVKLPGKQAQYRLAPTQRLADLEKETIPGNAVESSVLLFLYPDEGSIFTAVILRNEYDGAHSGQISLPGGRKERSDSDDYSTALRETREEIGIPSEYFEYSGALSQLYIPPSNYVVYPFVATSELLPEYTIDPKEVQKVIPIDLLDICKPGAMTEKAFHFRNFITFNAPGFEVGGHFMWGATAMIFSEFLQIIDEIAASPLS